VSSVTNVALTVELSESGTRDSPSTDGVYEDGFSAVKFIMPKFCADLSLILVIFEGSNATVNFLIISSQIDIISHSSMILFIRNVAT
jgi:hypothetical protein